MFSDYGYNDKNKSRLKLRPTYNYEIDKFYVYGSVHLWSILMVANEMQYKAVYLLFCKFTLHVSGVNHTHYQEYTKL